ncbi:MAG TPA: alpha/beta hydrolase-fold protein [Terracidiphilus sp.]|nr:alpha/beta hydrolase-fold protein [Terracidiphilus sp.]
MHRIANLLAVRFGPPVLALFLAATTGIAAVHSAKSIHRQDTGFLNRNITMHGVTYRFQVYLPEEWRRDDGRQWPIILFLHGLGERGSEGMWQTEIGLPEAVRDHPERWPFIIVLPQCPQMYYWTDPPIMAMAMAALDKETAEFHADPERTYLTGLSLGGYGAWELAKNYPKRWAAVAIASGGIFWSYAPQRWQQSGTLPQEYARAIGKTPIWLFHGSNDPVVPLRESELMYAAFKANGGHIRLWIYQGLKHDSWSRAYNEPDLPRWLLEHHLGEEIAPYAERAIIPLHPQAIPLSNEQLDALTGEYRDIRGLLALTVYRQGDTLYRKDRHGFVAELEAESPNALFYPKGDSISRLLVERDRQGRITALIVHDDRHEERLERIRSSVRNLSQ